LIELVSKKPDLKNRFECDRWQGSWDSLVNLGMAEKERMFDIVFEAIELPRKGSIDD
jgi:hypothetical protein